MAIFKKGTPNIITDVASTDSDFDKLRERVAKENNLVRCVSCSHLLAKKSADGVLDVQHKKAVFLIEKAEKVDIKCPICQSITAA